VNFLVSVSNRSTMPPLSWSIALSRLFYLQNDIRYQPAVLAVIISGGPDLMTGSICSLK